ncbi:hypothetical protein O6P43_020101 [Quillaja saponaria]|uniref:Uncharacterized protein n=1 Tax=Quillaja saponaria TaxID=32244 RepID=A0AAD7LK20_QUISA|nr:hypothetical protein O6P43_020101 [Quillaja saponaria]
MANREHLSQLCVLFLVPPIKFCHCQCSSITVLEKESKGAILDVKEHLKRLHEVHSDEVPPNDKSKLDGCGESSTSLLDESEDVDIFASVVDAWISQANKTYMSDSMSKNQILTST